MSGYRNQTLATLADADRARLGLERCDMPRGQRLEVCNRPNAYVYFLDHGLASVVHADSGIEIAMIGREGWVGLSVVMGVLTAAQNTVMLVSGSGWRAPATAVSRAMDESRPFRAAVLSYAHTFFLDVAARSAENAHNKLEERVARWLLVARDRLGSDELAVTHDKLSEKLGVRRAGVTISLRSLQTRGAIECSRGMITVVSSAALITASRGSKTRGDDLPNSI